ncbi:MAG: hypothetical protein M1833_005168 [Piccolia ochrophora]|nr:MAG: hypothetical protein M1833_005168 [Piccolia ochrophora]
MSRPLLPGLLTIPRSPVLDFLAPRLVQYRHAATTAAPTPSTVQVSPESNASKKPTRPLTDAQRAFLDSALRVNQAGELAATLIYTAQTPPLVNAHPSLRPLLAHMHAQEAGHFHTFNGLLAKHRIRPTAMYPVWQVAATALGWGTAMMGREAAMACTEAVETEIGEHYNGQVRVLLEMVRDMEAKGEVVGDELMGLLETVRKTRDEELEHLDHAVDNDAKKAEGHEILTNVIRGGCRAAIWVSERI